MIDVATAIEAGPQIIDEGRYQPGGRVAWDRFLPLAVASSIVAGLMAVALALAERYSYYILISPVFFSLPIIGTIILCIYVGRCRNPLIACGLSVLSMCIFYLGFWEISYYQNVLKFGRSAEKAMTDFIGVPGLGGYLLFRCRMVGAMLGSGPLSGMCVQVALRGLELGVLLATGLYVGRRFAGRVFFEDFNCWAASRAFCFRRADLGVVLEAIQQRNWALLEKVEKSAVTRTQKQLGFMVFRAEYVAGSVDQPVFLTVEGPILPRGFFAILPFLCRLVKRSVTQCRVAPESAHQLAEYFGGLGLGQPDLIVPALQPADGASVFNVPYWRTEPSVNKVKDRAGLASMIMETGYSGVSLVGKGNDFRAAASDASLRILSNAVVSDVSAVDASLCYPAQTDPVQVLKLISWSNLVLSILFLIAIIVAILAMFLAPAAAGASTAAGKAAGFAVVLGYAFGFSILAFQVFLFAPVTKHFMTRHFKRRPGALLTMPGKVAKEYLGRIEDPATFHIQKVTPEDWVIFSIDSRRRLLMMDGISHRYLIRAADILSISPLKSTSITVRVEYQIDNQPFTLVLARYGMGGAIINGLATYPGVGWIVRMLAGDPSGRFVRRLEKELAVTI